MPNVNYKGVGPVCITMRWKKLDLLILYIFFKFSPSCVSILYGSKPSVMFYYSARNVARNWLALGMKRFIFPHQFDPQYFGESLLLLCSVRIQIRWQPQVAGQVMPNQASLRKEDLARFIHLTWCGDGDFIHREQISFDLVPFGTGDNLAVNRFRNNIHDQHWFARVEELWQ